MSRRGLVILSFSVGALIGGSLSFIWIYRQVRHQIQRVLVQLSIIQEQLDSLNCLLQKNEDQNQQRNSDSAEDDDIFEEAYEDPLPWLSSFCSSPISRSENDKTTDNHNTDLQQDLFKQVDDLFNGNEADQRKAHELLDDKYFDMFGNVEFMWRKSKSTFLLSQIYGPLDKDKQKNLIYEALKYAKCALELDSSSANAHKWYAVTLGSTNDFENVNLKIQNGYHFKEHIQKAISLNPEDPSAHYLLGRWCYGVYMLSWIERKIAATLFSSPPKATIDESLNHFLKAYELNPVKWKENMLFIAKCYIEKKDMRQAVHWLIQAKKLPVITSEDSKNQSEIEIYLAKCAEGLQN